MTEVESVNWITLNMQEKQYIARRNTVISSLIFLVTFFIYFSFKSQWLDDWDSVQFVMAMDFLDLQSHQPHPPGYVAYIYLARALNVLFQDPARTLVVLSCLAGSLSIALLFLLGNHLKSLTAGALAAAILFTAPEFFRMSLVAMADCVVVPFFLGSVLLLFYGYERYDSLGLATVSLGGLLMGWGLGIRPQWVFLFAAVAICFLVSLRSGKKNIYLIFAGVAGTFAWLVPISYSQGGFVEYIKVCKGMFDSNPNTRLNYGANDFLSLVELLAQNWSIPLVILVCCAVFSGYICFVRFNQKETSASSKSALPFYVCLGMSCLLLVIATVGMLTFHSVRSNRMILPLLPLLAFICAILIDTGLKRTPWKNVRRLLIGAVTCSLILALYQSVSLGSLLHGSIPPPVQAAEFIKANYPSSNTILLSQGSYRHWQYYLPEYETVFVGTRQENFLEMMNPEGVIQGYTTIITQNQLAGENFGDTATFLRPYNVYFKHRKSTTYQYTLNTLHLFFVSGHYVPEALWFWIKERASGWIRSGEQGTEAFHLRIRAFHEPRQLILSINDNEVWAGIVPAHDVDLLIPLSLPDKWAKITLATPNGCQRPIDLQSSSADVRCLSFAVSSCYLGSDGASE